MRAVVAKQLRRNLRLVGEYDGIYMESIERSAYVPKHQRLWNPHTRILKELKREHRKK